MTADFVTGLTEAGIRANLEHIKIQEAKLRTAQIELDKRKAWLLNLIEAQKEPQCPLTTTTSN